jgi:hypothetical protein
MAQIIEFQKVQPRSPIFSAKQCCSRCGADVWHIGENGEIYCADCEQVCSLRLQLQVKNEY